MNVLVVNSGSSTLKFQVIATDLERIGNDQDDRICRGEVEGIGGEAIIRLAPHPALPDPDSAVARHRGGTRIPDSLHGFRAI